MKSKARFIRAELRFSDLVLNYFKFLKTYGFLCAKSEQTFVRFESPPLFINVYHGRSSFELGAEFGRIGKDEEQPYPMSALLEVAGIPTAKEYRDYATHTLDGVNDGLDKLAKLVREHIGLIFKNESIFQILKEQRNVRAKNFAQEINLLQMRRELEGAWQTKDYPKVVELLTPWCMAITPIELKKLQYAKEQKIGDAFKMST